jgi:hypothetical protein
LDAYLFDSLEEVSEETGGYVVSTINDNSISTDKYSIRLNIGVFITISRRQRRQ